MLLPPALGAALAASVAPVGTVREAQAAFPEEILFASNHTTGVKQLTSNGAPPVSPLSVLLMGTAGDEFWMNRR